MYHMKALGWDVWGNDVNGEALDIAERHGLEVCLGTLERCKYPDSFFDAVHLGDLIEHVRSPRSLASDIFRILRPGGIVMIATPNAQSGFAVSTLILARATGIAWPHSEAPYHLYDFSPATISALLRDAGIKLLSINYGSSGSFSYIVGSSGYFDDLKQVLKREGQYKLNSSIFGYIPKLVAVSALLLPFWLYGLIADKVARRGRSMIVIGQRPLACQLCD
jgi:SAM-dependent methyltransferase